MRWMFVRPTSSTRFGSIRSLRCNRAMHNRQFKSSTRTTETDTTRTRSSIIDRSTGGGGGGWAVPGRRDCTVRRRSTCSTLAAASRSFRSSASRICIPAMITMRPSRCLSTMSIKRSLQNEETKTAYGAFATAFDLARFRHLVRDDQRHQERQNATDCQAKLEPVLVPIVDR
jgi:hypothetical protein